MFYVDDAKPGKAALCSHIRFVCMHAPKKYLMRDLPEALRNLMGNSPSREMQQGNGEAPRKQCSLARNGQAHNCQSLK